MESPQGDLFDLVPVVDVLGATGQEWDLGAAESVESLQLDEHLSVRVPSAPVFVALKLAAFHDRGRSDSLKSDDLEDILALIASRESIVSEIERADPRVRAFVIQEITALSMEASLEDFLAAHLNGAMDPASAVNIVRRRLSLIAALGISIEQ